MSAQDSQGAQRDPVLRGWGNYFCTGIAARRFIQIDDYVRERLRRFMMQRHGRNLRAGRTNRWTPDSFHDHGLHRLRGTIRYPGTQTRPPADCASEHFTPSYAQNAQPMSRCVGSRLRTPRNVVR